MSHVTGQEDLVTTHERGSVETTQGRFERVMIHPKLHKAASENNLALLEKLLSPEKEDHVKPGETTINVASRALQEHNRVSVLGVTPTGDTALHVAAYFGHLDVARRICYENKHLLMQSNDKEEIPLHYAAQAGNCKLATLFIRFSEAEGGDAIANLLRKRNQDGETALYQAIRHCQVLNVEEKIFSWKFKLAHFHFGNERRKGIQELYEAEKNSHAAIAEELVRADLAWANSPRNQSLPPLACITDNNGISPLYLAIMQNSLSIVTSLVGSLPENASRAAYAGPDGQTALHAAAVRTKGFTEKILCWKPELTKSTDNFGSTPLHYAASHDIVETIKMLLEIDSTSAYVADSSGLCPIHLAAKLGMEKSAAMIFQHCPYSGELRDPEGRNFLHLAVKEKTERIISWACKNSRLVKAINSQDNNGDTPMHLAVQAGDVNIFALLLASQKINICVMNKYGMTPFDLACANRKIELGHWQNPNFIILRALHWIGCSKGMYRYDLFLSEHDLLIDQKKKEELAGNFENMAKSMAIGSTLIASAAFAGAYAISVAYKTDVQSGRVTAGLSLAFKAFILMAAYAFICSIAVTGFIVEAALTLLDINYRGEYIVLCSRLVPEAIKGFIVAFSLGVLVVMIQVSQWRLACVVCLSCGTVPVLIQPHFWPNLLVQRALIKYLGFKKIALVGGFGFFRNIAYGIIILLVLFGGKLNNSDLAERIVLTTIIAILLFISYPSIPFNRTTWIRTNYITIFLDHRFSLILLVTILTYLVLFSL